jgi:nucleotide-binding universal stress UspA family protein
LIMAFYQRVLVAVDGSPASLHALQAALQLANGELAVVVATPAGGSSPDLDTYWQQTQDKALSAAGELARATGVVLKTIAARGEPHEAIVTVAKEEACDLIVVGLKGRDLPAAALMGSTTARVIGFSPVAVLVVPEHADLRFARILTPADGSRYSRHAATEAVRLCAIQGGELTVLAVLDAPPGFAKEAPEVAEDLLAKLKEVTAEVQRRAESLVVPCQEAVLHGSAYRVITAEAQRIGASLIVMGSHGRTGLKRLLMGSVTERVIGHAPCPVLVVKGTA